MTVRRGPRSAEAKKRRAEQRQEGKAVRAATLKERQPFSTAAALCAVRSCDGPAIVGGYCEPHYLRSWLGQAMEPPIRSRRHEIPAVYLLPRIRG